MKNLFLLLTIILLFITGCDKKEMAPVDKNKKEDVVYEINDKYKRSK